MDVDGSNIFQYNGEELEVTDDMKRSFDKDGFIVVKNLASKEELAILKESLTGEGSVTEFAFAHEDPEGKQSMMCLWNTPGDDSTGLWARSRKMARTAEQLLGGEVYHYHTKLMMKEAKTGGCFVWHQDYGYWYDFACYFPDMLTTFVALDRCGKDNGCLEVLKGSHKCGRVNHSGAKIQQQGADPERVAEIEKLLPKVFVELQPGDALIFHCNVLHKSSANTSDSRRWALLTAYNKATNKPTKENVHGMYQPLDQVDNDAVVKLGVNRSLRGKNMLIKQDGEYKVLLQ